MGAAIRISLFGGIIPRLARRGLPDNAAQFAMNAKLYSGELRSWNQLRQVGTSSVTGTRTVFHYRYAGQDRYLTFAYDADVVKAPLVNETLERIYWTGPNGPKVTTTAAIEAGQPPFDLGIPGPPQAVTVTPSGGTAQNATSRVYVLIWVSAFGEEGQASPPAIASGNSDGTWTIGNLQQAPPANRNITHARLYRTVTSPTGVDYRQVVEWPIASVPATYDDTQLDVAIADNPVLQSLEWSAPPATLQGLIGVAGGYLAGFVGRTVRLSVPYYPHAWPEDYSYAVEDTIVGLGTFGNTVVVLTEGRPYLLVGPSPDAMSLQKLEAVQPCLSKRSIVNTVAGIMFASTDGLVLVDGTANTGVIASRNWVTKDEWLALFLPRSIQASVYQDRYLAFYTDELGFTVGFDDPVTGWTQLQEQNVQSVDLDTLTGQTLVTVSDPGGGNDLICEWDDDTTEQVQYTWRSKPFMQNKPVNFGAMQLRASFVGSSGPVPPPPPIPVGTHFGMGVTAINGGYRTTLLPSATPETGGSINGPPAWQMLGITFNGQPLVAPGVQPTDHAPTAIAVKVYGDNVLRWFGAVEDEMPVRLPSGYKAYLWEVEVQGVSPLFSITLADTVKNLENLP